MSTATKLSYLNETKSQLKDMINYGLDDNNKITSSTTFRNYVTSIFNAFLEALRTPDTLFTNLPKKSGTGANITLNDTANAPMRITLGATELTQASTPTPSSPQDIHTISGSNKVVVCGKNLAYTGWAEDFVSRINDNTKAKLEVKDNRNCLWYTAGAGYQEYDTKYIFKINWKANTQYTIYFDMYTTANSGNIKVLYTDGTQSSLSTIPTNEWTRVTFKTQEKTIKYICGLWSSGSSYIDLDTFMVYEGLENLPYEPYTSQEADIDLPVQNIFDFSNISISSLSGGTTTVQNEQVIFTANGSVYGIQFNIKNIVKNNTTYTISNLMTSTGTMKDVASGWRYYDGSTFTPLNAYRTRFTFTTGNSTTHMLYYYVGSPQTYNGTLTLSNIQLELGSKANAYTPYGIEPIEYCKIGNYEDKIFKNIPAFTEYDNTLEEGAWYIKKNIGKVVFDGSETSWVKYAPLDTTNNNCYYIPINTLYVDSTGATQLCLSNYFKGVSFNNKGADIPNMWVSKFSTQLSLKIQNTITTTAELQTWLSTHNTTVYYVLATPTYTQITGTLANQLEQVYKNMLSQTGQTNISQVNNDLAFELNVSALEDIS